MWASRAPFIDRVDNLDGALTALKIQKARNKELATERRCIFTVLIDGAEKTRKLKKQEQDKL